MSDNAATEAAHGDEQGHGDSHDQHYIRIWKWLVVLLIISIVGPELGIQVVTLITAFGIALVKAYMVCKHFMHVDMEKPYIHYLMVVSLMLMVLFFTAVAPDVMNHEGSNWQNEAAAKEVNTRIESKLGEADHTRVKYNHGVLHDPGALWGQEGFEGYQETAPQEGGGAHH
jgi:caa(3)-type oxidase subunit IV